MSEYLNQFRKFKASNPTFILFFLVGDFYELFDADADTAARTLGLTLTTKDGVQSAGVPAASVENYLRRMIAAGHRCAICQEK